MIMVQDDKYEEKRNYLIRCSRYYNGDWTKTAIALRTKERIPDMKICDHCLTVYDPSYPEKLRRLRYPPWVIYYRGDLSLLERPAATVVGSRDLCDYGASMTVHCVRLLSDRFVIVSGLAKGADSMAHRTAIADGGKTIGVIGSGLNVHYPKGNEDLYRIMGREHLILSEYPDDTGVKRHHFPWRNRILAALGDCVIVTQAAMRSGTMLTVNEALELGKEVWCCPYPYNAEEGRGCNALIYQGANILYEDSVLEQLHPLRQL